MDDSDVLRRWSKDPLAFVQEALRVERITRQQQDVLEAVGALVRAKLKLHAGEKLTAEEAALAIKVGVSIMAGVGTGKDAVLAWLIAWFLVCFPYPKIPCTAPTAHQLRDVLWGEVNKWIRYSAARHKEIGSGFDLTTWLTWQADRIFFSDLKGREWFAVARTANPRATVEEQAETLAGFHEDFLMVIADEASGIPEPTFRPLEATMTGKCNFAVLAFNPTRSTGFALDTQGKDRARWVAFRWNAEDSELVSRESIDHMKKKYGVDSNAYRIRVLGLPPLAEPDVTIPWDWVMSCVELELDPLDDDPIVMAIDPARKGDDPSVIIVMHGPKVIDIREFRKLDTEELTGWCMAAAFDFEPTIVLIDSIGIGAGVYDKLWRRLSCHVIDVCVSEIAARDDKFHRLRDELWWKLRERFEKRSISIPADDELIGELTTPKYDPGDDGRIRVESKRKLRSRGVASPNKADALCMCQYYETEFVRRMKHAATGVARRRDSASWRTA